MPKGYPNTSRSLSDILKNTLLIPFSGCKLWLGNTDKKGYGRITHRGRKCFVHRLVKMMQLGISLSPEQLVLHKCDTPLCCNPEHLFVGTKSDNAQDMIRKGRDSYRLGEANHSAKCKTADVIRIKSLKASGLSCRAVAEAVGVTTSIVENISCGRTWKHVK